MAYRQHEPNCPSATSGASGYARGVLSFPNARRVVTADASSKYKRMGAAQGLIGRNHFFQQHNEHDGLRLAQPFHCCIRNLFCLRNHLSDNFFAGLGDHHLGLALILGIASNVQQASAAQAVEYTSRCGRVYRRGTDNVDDGAGATIHHCAQHDELNGREFFPGAQFLEDGRVMLVGPAQKMADLLGKIITLFGRRCAVLSLIDMHLIIEHACSGMWASFRCVYQLAHRHYIAGYIS